MAGGTSGNLGTMTMIGCTGYVRQGCQGHWQGRRVRPLLEVELQRATQLSMTLTAWHGLALSCQGASGDFKIRPMVLMMLN
mmetsp:Transcript_19080/g.52608  ORF Transcript_19080/g.52608 Transcript_19080/m.52608 type:complete len:81 (-) Transcript_19080:1682-1924(-)